MRRPLPIILFSALFLACVVGAWAWFNVGTADSSDTNGAPRIWLEAKTDLPGYTFRPEPVGEDALSILATTNIINGVFIPDPNQERGPKTEDGGQRPEVGGRRSEVSSPSSVVRSQSSSVRVFLATWQAKDAKGLTVVHHTPDICWVGAGWKPIDLGQPTQILLTFPSPATANQEPRTTNDERGTKTEDRGPKTEDGGQRAEAGGRRSVVSSPLSVVRGSLPPHSPLASSLTLPFECRVFQSPDGTHHELVIWCTLVGGRLLPESERFGDAFKQTKLNDPDGRERMNAPARRLVANQLWQALKARTPTRGTKQFARCSVAVESDWQSAVDQVRVIGSKWITPT